MPAIPISPSHSPRMSTGELGANGWLAVPRPRAQDNFSILCARDILPRYCRMPRFLVGGKESTARVLMVGEGTEKAGYNNS